MCPVFTHDSIQR
jgi:hypothetical protein